MTPADLFKARRPQAVDAARDAAMADYAVRFDVLAERQQVYRGVDSDLAHDVGIAASIVRRARETERTNPEPRANLRQSFCCIPCHVYYIAAAQNRGGV